MAIGSNFFEEANYAEGGYGARHIQRKLAASLLMSWTDNGCFLHTSLLRI
jgi:hypothetical protein